MLPRCRFAISDERPGNSTLTTGTSSADPFVIIKTGRIEPCSHSSEEKRHSSRCYILIKLQMFEWHQHRIHMSNAAVKSGAICVVSNRDWIPGSAIFSISHIFENVVTLEVDVVLLLHFMHITIHHLLARYCGIQKHSGVVIHIRGALFFLLYVLESYRTPRWEKKHSGLSVALLPLPFSLHLPPSPASSPPIHHY